MMTQPDATPALPRKPASVALSELAIAAGAAGQSVTLCYQEFAAPVLCQLWKYCVTFAGPGEVQHIHSQADVRSLMRRIARVRLAPNGCLGNWH